MEQKDGERIATLDERSQDHERRLDAVEKDVESLNTFRGWIVGAAAVMAYVAGIFSGGIKHLISLVIGK